MEERPVLTYWFVTVTGRAVGILCFGSNILSRVWLTPGMPFCPGQRGPSNEGHRDRTHPTNRAGRSVYLSVLGACSTLPRECSPTSTNKQRLGAKSQLCWQNLSPGMLLLQAEQGRSCLPWGVTEGEGGNRDILLR